ncbi:pro-sigmaK processing inhibitor BofA family protein [Phosphitispora fastidiosa]|uniref:pro-sigmaK processing inhibitor BofA family protein n=1 Tax=Phosphitispora fastidiosa TaxID=2837202 RepID=UPI001E3A63F7|nr:pro-sigmaK processing inhibitor BofA family protein [Phosphitispora fastidiosa]MBU7007595.1 inhibitor of the pro-sigma K processing machinery [Phosphitispora fastidiosa]
MDLNIVMAFVLGLLLLYLVGRVMVVPIKLIVKLIVNGIVGGLVLWVVNYFGAFLNLHIPLNPVTALTAGFLGIPGIVLLIVIQQIIVK